MKSHRLPGRRTPLRARLGLVLLGLLAFGLSKLPAQTTTRYEAESAMLSGCSVAASTAGFSGSGYVDGGSFGSPDTITFTVNTAAAGPHTLRLRYDGGFGLKYQDVQINSGAYAYTDFPASSGWATRELTNIALNAGANTVRLRASWGWNSFDYLEVVSPATLGPVDDIGAVAWPPDIAATGPASATASFTITTGRRLKLTVFDANWGWRGDALADLTANGSATVSLPSFSAITTGTATLRLALQNSAGTITYESIDKSGVPVVASGGGGGDGGGAGAYTRVRQNVGTNFWFVYDGEVPEGFTGGLVFDPAANFATTSNPWNATFLNEIKPYQVLRFMDWFGGNGDGQVDWNSHRTRKADPIQQGDVMGPVVNGYFTDISPADQGGGRRTTGVAVEWLIDLCNRNQSDMWINIPYRTINPADFPNGDDFNNEYVHKLAILLRHGVDMRGVSLKNWIGGKANLPLLATKTKADFVAAGGIDTGYALNAARKIYVEYSNELWCCSRPQVKWVEDQGAALGFATRRHFGAWAEVRVWKAFQDVFGASAMGGARVWRVAGPTHKEGLNAYSFQGYFDNVYRNSAANRNPWYAGGGAGSVKPDAWKWAAYVGGDGSESDWNARVESERSDALALRAVMANSFGITKLFAYEGGQHLDSNAGPFSNSASSYDRYRRWLDRVDDAYDLVLHYGHYGKWQAANSTDGYGSWGAKSVVGQPDEQAHKYRAIKAHIDGL